MEKLEKASGGVAISLKNGTEFEVDQVMVAVSFMSNVEDIGLESAGVALEGGAIRHQRWRHCYWLCLEWTRRFDHWSLHNGV